MVSHNALLKMIRIKKGCSVEGKCVVRHVDASSAWHQLSLPGLQPSILYSGRRVCLSVRHPLQALPVLKEKI
jgi:hypothetical protein